ncbi:MAG TPA: biotin transporter BioY [bacterium]|nr:biotin transporter BioY [bacterium]
MEYISKRWTGLWQKYYDFFASLTVLKKLSVSLGFALLTGLSAQIYIKMPFTPVPFTAQVFVVLLAGVLLGKNFGAISQAVYLAGGAAGINWFFSSGSGFFRHTTGYVIGFALASYVIGSLTEKSRSRLKMTAAMLAGVVILLFSGTMWLSFFLRMPLSKAFAAGFLPFLPLDTVKACLAAITAGSILKSGVKK